MAFVAIGYSLIQLVGEYLSDQQVQHDSGIAETVSRVLGTEYDEMDAGAMYEYATRTVAENGGRILIIDNTATVAVDSLSEYNGCLFYTDVVRDVLNGKESAYSLWSDNSVRGLIYRGTDLTGIYASALNFGSADAGVVVYISDSEDIYLSLRDLQNKVIFWLVIVTLCALALIWFTSRLFTDPIAELSEGISRMAHGDLSTRVRVVGKNEFSQLAIAFNNMTEQLERLDASRSGFVSNASHELKTPLATIKLLIQSIMYQQVIDPDITREFAGDIDREIDRLNRIVSDLLTLVGMDSGGTPLRLSQIDLRNVVKEQVSRLMPLAQENSISLTCEAQTSIGISADPDKLGQVIYNLTDNAIKYTPADGSVTVSLVRSGKSAVITVRDTGIGIPENDLPHIFDRFYRVDKARSRATGGTGLGLSIVRQIVLLHGGEITAASVVGNGTTFTVSLPLTPASPIQEVLP